MNAKKLFEDAEPEPQKPFNLERIFTAIPQPARGRIVRLLKQHYPDYSGKIGQLLRAELQPLAKELGAIGLLPDYAAYLIPYYVYTLVNDVSDIDGLNQL